MTVRYCCLPSLTLSQPSEITKENLNTLLPKGKAVAGKVVSELLIDEEGRVETVNGKVVEAVDRIGSLFPVSLYLTKLDVQDATKVSLTIAQMLVGNG